MYPIVAVFGVFFVSTYAHITVNETNEVDALEKLPEIEEGDPCEAGKTYRMHCNVCNCSPKNVLNCTKMICPDQHRIIYLATSNKSKNKTELANDGKTEKNITRTQFKKIIGVEEWLHEADIPLVLDANSLEKDFKKRNIEPKLNKKSLRYGDFPPLPKGECVPGRVYTDGCKKCLCNDRREIACSVKDYCVHPEFLVTEPEDVIPPVEYEQYKDLPALSDQSDQCTPGQTVRVDCNICICDESGNLVCDDVLCLNPEGTKSNEALAKSGIPCTFTDVQEENCIRCVCNNKTKCSLIQGCVTNLEKSLRSLPVPNRLDWKTEKCKPNVVYSHACNKCFCTKTGMMRCTEKLCLKYRDLEKLKHDMELLFNGD